MNRNTPFFALLCALAGCGNSAAVNDSGVASDVRNDRDSASTDEDATSSDDTPVTASNRDFTLDARGMTAYQGSALGVWVVDSTGQSVIGFGYTDALRDPDLEFRMPDLVPEGDYHADVFVDANHDGSFDAGETSWRLDVPTTGSATVHLTGTTTTMDIASPARVPRQPFTATLSGFTSEEAGHRFELRVIDQNSRATVGAFLSTQLGAGGSLTVTLPGVIDSGNGYNVDFFVDVDGSGTYGGPPSDHAWRATVTGGDNGAQLSWSHDENYTEIDWR